MARITWTDQSLDDLGEICLFIARNAPRYAEMFAIRVFQATDRLAKFPLMGRVVPEIGREEIREIIVQGYRLIYRLSADEAETSHFTTAQDCWESSNSREARKQHPMLTTQV